MDFRRAAHITLLAAAGAIAASPLHAQSAAGSVLTADTHRSAAPALDTTRADVAALPLHSSRRGTATAVLQPHRGNTAALQDGSGWNWLGTAKWSTAALATGAAVYGVVSNRQADQEYEQLERLCVEESFRCTDRLPNGAYADADMEARYQEVRTLDRRARRALIAGQIGVAASVALFILDLRNADGPANIPYEPRTLDVMPARDGGMSLRVNLRMPRR